MANDHVKTAEDHDAEVADDYGQWLANRVIPHDGSVAYAPGHPVPHSLVVKHGYHEMPGGSWVDPVGPKAHSLLKPASKPATPIENKG